MKTLTNLAAGMGGFFIAVIAPVTIFTLVLIAGGWS